MNATLAMGLPWVQALGWTLLHFIWQGLVIGIGFAASRALLPRTHCNARYAVGLGALAALAIWPLATLIALRPHPADGIVLGVGATVDGATSASAGVDALAPIDHLLPLLVLLWCVGVLIVAARALRQWRVLARVAREWAHSSDELDALLAGLTRRFRFVRRIRVLVCSRIDTPMLIGWLKPVVLLPTAVALGFPRQQVELILAHELGHLRRYDHLVNLAQALLETLLFYHPVVHWISREVRNERELCCDALVLRLTASEPREYARTLAALEELRQPAMHLALAASGGVLIERVRRIVGMPAPRLGVERANPARWLLIAALFAMAVGMSLRVDRDGEARYVGGLTVDWLAQPDVRALPIAALTLPFERPHLRLALVAPKTPVTPTPDVTANITPVSRIERAPAVPVAHPAITPLPVQANAPTIAKRAAVAAAPTVVAPSTEGKSAPAPAVAAPVARHIVMPRFPASARDPSGRVDASFRIDADGSVQDIRIGNADAGGTFAVAAERALRQWRFDPATVSADRSRRYEQSFVFAPRGAQTPNPRSDASCVQSTGTHICRSPEDSGAVTTLAVGPRH